MCGSHHRDVAPGGVSTVTTCLRGRAVHLWLMSYVAGCWGWGWPLWSAQVFGRTFEFFKSHKDLAAPLDPSRDVTKKAGQVVSRVRRRRLSVVTSSRVLEVTHLHRAVPYDASDEDKLVYAKIKATSDMLQERGRRRNRDDMWHEHEHVTHLTTTDQVG